MSATHRHLFRLFAVVAFTATATGFAAAQFRGPPPATHDKKDAARKGDGKKAAHPPPHPKKHTPAPHPQPQPAPQPAPPQPHPAPARPNPVMVMPQINGLPHYPSPWYNNPVPLLTNPALDNPWMNPMTVSPVPVNPFAMNPFFNNPLAINPLLRNPAINNPFGVPGFRPTFPTVTSAPPVATKERGTYYYYGPDKQVNTTTGTVYHPVTGTVRMADGSTFYRVPGSGVPTPTGGYSMGTGLYYNPQGGTFFNPASGVLSKPGSTNVFLPYVW